MRKPKTYNCPECGKVYRTERGLNAHLASAHPKEPDRTIELAEERAVNEPVAFMNIDQPKEDAKKFWSWKWGKWVLGIIVLLLLWFIWIKPWIELENYDEATDSITNSEQRIKELQEENDSLKIEQRAIDSAAVLAIDLYHEAKEEADAAVKDYRDAKASGSKTLSDINKRSNETQYRINKASSIRSLDSLYEEITSSGRFKVHENK